MRTLVAWRILSYEIARSILAIFGVFAAIILVFLQLGFYSSVPTGSMSIYHALEFDIALVSKGYSFQIRPHSFSRRRLYQALALPEILSATPLYQNFGRWLNAGGRLQREIFVMGFDPDSNVFQVPGIRSKAAELKLRDTALIDDSTRPVFGSRVAGSYVEVNRRRVQIKGSYSLGTGFLGLGVMVVSDLNFIRLFPDQKLDEVNVGLLRLKPGSDPDATARRLRNILPADTRVYTRQEFARNEIDYWMNSTSTGLVFGFGVLIASIVGAAILFQTLSSLITKNIPEFATLKAIGYTDRYLSGIVMIQAVLISVIAFLPAVFSSYALYDVTREATLLPVFMTPERIVAVMVATVGTAVLAALLTMRILRQADPIDLF